MDEKELKVKLILALLQLKEHSPNELVYPIEALGIGCPSYNINEVLKQLDYQDNLTS